MPTTRQLTTKITTRVPKSPHLLHIPPHKLKNTPQRTLTASNLPSSQTPTAQTTTQYAPEDTPSLHLKHPNSYNSTLASPPPEPDQHTTPAHIDLTTTPAQTENTPPPDTTQIHTTTTPTNQTTTSNRIEATDTNTKLTEQPRHQTATSTPHNPPRRNPLMHRPLQVTTTSLGTQQTSVNNSLS